MDLSLKDVNIVYDIHAELKDKTDVDGTLLITYPNMDFQISISGKSVDQSLAGEISGLQHGKIIVEMYPKTAPVQIIGREVRNQLNIFS